MGPFLLTLSGYYQPPLSFAFIFGLLLFALRARLKHYLLALAIDRWTLANCFSFFLRHFSPSVSMCR